MTPRVLFFLGLTSACLAGPALADSYKFKLHNDSQYAITGFQTYEDGRWSTWSGVDVAPGETQVMDWQSDEGDCVAPFRVVQRDRNRAVQGRLVQEP